MRPDRPERKPPSLWGPDVARGAKERGQLAGRAPSLRREDWSWRVSLSQDVMRNIAPAELAPAAIYKLLISLVVPRPIAWVASLSPAGVANLAPHSYFMILAADPAILGFSSVGTKDTLRNIQATGEYVINIAGEELVERLNLSSGDFPPEESEFAWAGLTPAASLTVAPPSVAEAPVAFEMRLLHVTPYGHLPNHLIVGEVSHIRVRESILAPGGEYADPARLRAIGRMGGPSYIRTTDLFNLDRPRYADLVQQGRPG